MALRITGSQIVQVGRDRRRSASPSTAWAAARVLPSQGQCFAFLLIEFHEGP